MLQSNSRVSTSKDNKKRALGNNILHDFLAPFFFA